MTSFNKMPQRCPPTPPKSGELHYGFQKTEQQSPSEVFYPFGPGSEAHLQAYASPTDSNYNQSQGLPYQFGSSPYSETFSAGAVGLGIQHVGYDMPTAGYYQAESDDHSSFPTASTGSRDDMPLTPKSTNSESGNRSRRGQSTGPSDSKVRKRDTSGMRVVKAPRTRKPKAGKTGSTKTPQINAPLSELTKNMTDIPVRDIEAWVNRSTEVRQEEVKKRNGYVTRPMNSFMLYRSAYAERTKIWCLQNNHQIVSAVSGESWPLEPPEVREQYVKYANIERANHAKANPTYKFSPSKAAVSGRKKRDNYSSDEEDDEVANSDDSDGEWAPRNRARTIVESNGNATLASRSPDSSPLDSYDGMNFVPTNGHGLSAWQASNGSKPLPTAIGSGPVYQQFYQAGGHSNSSYPAFEDVRFQRIETPGNVYYGTMPSGLPGAYHPDLFRLNSRRSSPSQYDSQLNPTLVSTYETAYMEDSNIQSTNGNMSSLVLDGEPSHGLHLFDGRYGQLEPRNHFDEWFQQSPV